MKGIYTSISTVTLAVVLGAPLVAAQWPSFVRKDVPRASDGKPNLAAAAPRMADGKPDFSGVWENAPIGSGGGGGRQGEASRPLPPGEPPLATFFNVGAGFPGGLPFRPWAKELLEKRRADNDKLMLAAVENRREARSEPHVVRGRETLIGHDLFGFSWLGDSPRREVNAV